MAATDVSMPSLFSIKEVPDDPAPHLPLNAEELLNEHLYTEAHWTLGLRIPRETTGQRRRRCLGVQRRLRVYLSSTREDPMAEVWLVTGSASGLGRDIADAVLASGDRLVATARDRPPANLVVQYGDQVRTARLDVADDAGGLCCGAGGGGRIRAARCRRE